MATKNASTNPQTKTSYNNIVVYILIILGVLSGLVHHLSVGKYLKQESIDKYIDIRTMSLIFLSAATATAVILLQGPRRRKVYLVDFACYKHDPCFSVSKEAVYGALSGHLSPESLAFTQRAVERTGVSDTLFVYGLEDFPPKSSFACARGESEVVICGAVDDLLAKTAVDPARIGIVIVNVSLFNPIPSLSAMIVNRYKLRQDVATYNLGGMGCSAGLIAVDLAKRLLQLESKSSYALIMSLECPTSSYYLGDERSKLLANCLFRMGGAAVLLSNRRAGAKYELSHTVRTHLGADDRAYRCVFQEPDEGGKLGVTLSKELMRVAGDALKANISALAPLVLPPSEKLRFLARVLARKVVKVAPYTPDFTAAFEHFCIHAGGRAVLDAVEEKLHLSEWDMEPSRMTLHRYCNTSSSSVWYELAYAEAKGRIRKGDRVWQIGFGSGFKCASGVWRALRTISPHHLANDNPWADVIQDYPILIPAP